MKPVSEVARKFMKTHGVTDCSAGLLTDAIADLIESARLEGAKAGVKAAIELAQDGCAEHLPASGGIVQKNTTADGFGRCAGRLRKFLARLSGPGGLKALGE